MSSYGKGKEKGMLARREHVSSGRPEHVQMLMGKDLEERGKLSMYPVGGSLIE